LTNSTKATTDVTRGENGVAFFHRFGNFHGASLRDGLDHKDGTAGVLLFFVEVRKYNNPTNETIPANLFIVIQIALQVNC
jgi:hypothetical protein